MPSYRADRRPLEQSSVKTGALFGLSTIERACIRQLVGHKLAHVEREFILQTLRFYRGNRTRAADLLGISIRSLRNKIRDYRNQGEDVPPPEASAAAHRRAEAQRTPPLNLWTIATTHPEGVARNPRLSRAIIAAQTLQTIRGWRWGIYGGSYSWHSY